MDDRSLVALTAATIILLLVQLQLVMPPLAGVDGGSRTAELRRLGVVYAAAGPHLGGGER